MEANGKNGKRGRGKPGPAAAKTRMDGWPSQICGSYRAVIESSPAQTQDKIEVLREKNILVHDCPFTYSISGYLACAIMQLNNSCFDFPVDSKNPRVACRATTGASGQVDRRGGFAHLLRL